jgi:hypothetical protein
MELRIIHVDQEIAAELGIGHAFDLRIGTWSDDDLAEDLDGVTATTS